MVNAKIRSQRADWQRNHERLVAAAAALVARDGADVSLEEIAREAGVGSATLHRHFSSRHALLDEVFQGSLDHLRRRAEELADGEPRTGIITWLEELTAAAAETRGLAASLGAGEACHAVIRDATTVLVNRAHTAAAIRPEVSADDLLTLVTAVSLVAEGDASTARRLLDVALVGALS
ncbi:TetR family transcriptional regulator [Prauserella muralis]|uniref:TetR family transcriptional regulator n=1 Tax=Prauserella muralis TaxID=588067 RepID=A0A2V4AID4_9PSEU|nr:TetR family transcriptional regulator [Prauserella muralis]